MFTHEPRARVAEEKACKSRERQCGLEGMNHDRLHAVNAAAIVRYKGPKCGRG